MRLTVHMFLYDKWGDNEREVLVTGTVSSLRRGVTNALPEMCYPDEGGDVEVETATLDGKPYELTDEQLARAIEMLAEKAAEEDDVRDVEDYDVG